MAFFDTVKSGFTTAVDTVSEVTQSLIEKNRATAQLNRLRAVMKSECEMINRAYITLGKNYYENKLSGKNDACPNEEELFNFIEQSKENIQKARERYRQVIESQTPELVTDYDISDLEDITVSCSNEDEYQDSPFVEAEKSDAPEEEDITIEVATDENSDDDEATAEVADDEEPIE